MTDVDLPVLVWQSYGSISYSDGVLIWVWCSPVEQKNWGPHAGASPSEKKLEIRHQLRGREAVKRQICFTADLSKPSVAPRPGFPEERRMEAALTATRRRVSKRRLMLHIKQTKEIANLIVPHSLAQPNISKSDSLSLSQSKTLYN